jgi:hypothetical protein
VEHECEARGVHNVKKEGGGGRHALVSRLRGSKQEAVNSNQGRCGREGVHVRKACLDARDATASTARTHPNLFPHKPHTSDTTRP